MTSRVVMIGSGFSSVCLAALLVRKGYRVEILEQSDRIGGYAQDVEFGGYRFSAGPRYLWDFGEGDPGTRFFESLGIMRADDFVRLDEDCFDEIYIGSRQLMRVPMGWEAYRERMKEAFPDESIGLDRFFDRCAEVYEYFTGYVALDLDLIGPGALFWHMCRSQDRLAHFRVVLGNGFKTLEREFSRCRLSQTVRGLLSAHLAVMAESPREVSFAGYVLATLNYHRGAYYPRDHVHGMLKRLVDLLESKGVLIHTQRKVNQIELEGNRIRRVHCDDGYSAQADLFVSNIDPATTLEMISGRRSQVRPWYERSNSLLSFFVGCEVPAGTSFPFGRAQKWYLRDEHALHRNVFGKKQESDRDFPAHLYLNSPSTFSESEQLGPTPDSRVLTGFAPDSFDLSSDRSPERIAAQQEAILETIERNLWPEVRRCVREFRIHSPSDNQRLLLAPEGHIYGRRMRPRDVYFGRVRFDSSFENLKFCSAFTHYPGIASCIRGASFLYKRITGEAVFPA